MKKIAIVLTGLALFAFFYGLGSYGLIDPDEGRYAEISREMLETGDFVTPRLNYVKYFEKPVLHYWLTAASFAVFGPNEAAARLTPVLCALGGAWIVFATARRMWGPREGLYGAAILSTCLLWFVVARLNILDMTVTFFITLSAAGFWRGCAEEKEEKGEKDSRRYLLLFYGGMALATLSKGLIGVVLPGGIAFFYILAARRPRLIWRLILRSLYWPGIVLFFLLVAPWFWAVCRANGDFFHFFFVREHLLRYTTRMHARYQPFWYFLPILAGGLVPWTGLLPDMLRDTLLAWKAGNTGVEAEAEIKGEKAPEVFLGLWFAVPFVFFSLSGSKLIPYILPCFPPLAILGGRALAAVSDGDSARGRRFALINGGVLAALAAAGILYPLTDAKLGANELYPYTLPAAAVFLIMALWGRYAKGVPVFCALAFLNLAVLGRGFVLKAELDSYKEQAALIEKALEPGDVVAAYKAPAQGLGFYLKRRVVLVDVLGELEFGALQEKDPRWFIDSRSLETLWNGKSEKARKKRVFLVSDKSRWEELTRLLGENNVIQWGWTRDGVILSNF